MTVTKDLLQPWIERDAAGCARALHAEHASTLEQFNRLYDEHRTLMADFRFALICGGITMAGMAAFILMGAWHG